MCWAVCARSSIWPTPSLSSSSVRNTPQWRCIDMRMALATSWVFSPEVRDSSSSTRASDRSTASLGSGWWACWRSGCESTIWLPVARPKTIRSSSELVPRRLAPCTDTAAHSPMAYRPLTILFSPLARSSTWPW
ncbi:Uncharacterised protein [Bordetella pertussis]|nr:Uncharacterised protein [Bordetella pertussis]